MRRRLDVKTDNRNSVAEDLLLNPFEIKRVANDDEGAATAGPEQAPPKKDLTKL